MKSNIIIKMTRLIGIGRDRMGIDRALRGIKKALREPHLGICECMPVCPQDALTKRPTQKAYDVPLYESFHVFGD